MRRSVRLHLFLAATNSDRQTPKQESPAEGTAAQQRIHAQKKSPLTGIPIAARRPTVIQPVPETTVILVATIHLAAWRLRVEVLLPVRRPGVGGTRPGRCGYFKPTLWLPSLRCAP